MAWYIIINGEPTQGSASPQPTPLARPVPPGKPPVEHISHPVQQGEHKDFPEPQVTRASSLSPSPMACLTSCTSKVPNAHREMLSSKVHHSSSRSLTHSSPLFCGKTCLPIIFHYLIKSKVCIIPSHPPCYAWICSIPSTPPLAHSQLRACCTTLIYHSIAFRNQKNYSAMVRIDFYHSLPSRSMTHSPPLHCSMISLPT